MSCIATITAFGLSVYVIVVQLLLSPYSKAQDRGFSHMHDPDWQNFSYYKIIDYEFDWAIEYGTQQVDMFARMESSLTDNNIKVQNGTSAYGQYLEYMPNHDSHIEARDAEILLKVSQQIRNMYCSRFDFSERMCAYYLMSVKLPQKPYGEKCASIYYSQVTDTYCHSNEYRSPNGHCNNLLFKSRGQANTPYKRLMFPSYGDGISTIKELPSARLLSHAFVTRKCGLQEEKSMTMAIWAAFIGHDMSHTALSTKVSTEDSILCCDAYGTQFYPRFTHPFCAPIMIPKNDSIYSVPRYTCMNYVRSRATMRSDCTFGPREQLNQATHFLDGSALYGSSAKRMSALRNPNSGRGQILVHQVDHDVQYLSELFRGPCSATDTECARIGGNGANVHPMLTAMYTIWVREHNRIANELSYINAHWRDEKIFQETRKIVTALIQHITYNEWLPALVGDEHFLNWPLEDHKQPYDRIVDPGVSNAFAVGVLQPMIHSMMTDVVKFYNENGTEKECISLKTYYAKSHTAQMNYTDLILKGMTLQRVQKVGMSFTKYITNFLYSDPHRNALGMDALALDIQRARDHGIPSYTRFRQFCGFSAIKNWDDLGNAVSDINILEKLKKFYNTWDDVDLIVGALLEKEMPHSMIGPTMACIIKEQFIRTKRGDRQFYDHPYVFKKEQLAEIKRMTLARVLCDNSREFTRIQINVFKKSTQLYPCYITWLITPEMNLRLWMEPDPK
ncbi:Haem peroxidase,Haem peroxidase, animal type [Cinara cedri]|uniref:Haem peroxidase,Haem peroxidase, animal type n=1 Tax=Cinara cedri TaxID=506608 RepID=A0A5E4M6S5_9HEMI|nr:Haem peroxidase,Haem peroxidase, animal type [Cinara cedri]